MTGMIFCGRSMPLDSPLRFAGRVLLLANGLLPRSLDGYWPFVDCIPSSNTTHRPFVIDQHENPWLYGSYNVPEP